MAIPATDGILGLRHVPPLTGQQNPISLNSLWPFQCFAGGPGSPKGRAIYCRLIRHVSSAIHDYEVRNDYATATTCWGANSVPRSKTPGQSSSRAEKGSLAGHVLTSAIDTWPPRKHYSGLPIRNVTPLAMNSKSLVEAIASQPTDMYVRRDRCGRGWGWGSQVTAAGASRRPSADGRFWKRAGGRVAGLQYCSSGLL
jgi:hypothetical protein